MDHIHGREDCRSSGAPAWFGLWTLFRVRHLPVLVCSPNQDRASCSCTEKKDV